MFANVSIVLALDAMDSSGEQHLEMDHNIYKRRLDLDGKPIADPNKVNITIAKNTTVSSVTVSMFEKKKSNILFLKNP